MSRGPRRLPRRGLPSSLALAVASVVWLEPAAAEAFEKQWHLGVQTSYQLFIRPTLGGLHGIGGSAHLTYGLTDMFNLLVEAGVSVHPDPGYAPDAPRPELVVPYLNAGVSYVFDVLQWVPWVGLTAGAYDVIGSSSAACFAGANGAAPGLCNEMRLGLSVPFGLEYQPNREVAIGVNGKYTLLLFGPDVEHLVTAGLRVEHMWGY